MYRAINDGPEEKKFQKLKTFFLLQLLDLKLSPKVPIPVIQAYQYYEIRLRKSKEDFKTAKVNLITAATFFFWNRKETEKKIQISFVKFLRCCKIQIT